SNQDWNDPILINYEQKGEKLERDFDSPGYYRVFAYGNPDSKWDNRAALDVEVIENRLDKDKKGITTVGGNVVKTLIRRGVPTVFRPAFLMTPSAEEKERVQMWASDDAGNRLDTSYSAETGLTVTPENHGQKINIHITYTTQTGKEQSFTTTYKSVNNSVMEVKPTPPEAVFYRPGTTINFTATKMKFSMRVIDAIEREEWARIKWNVNGQTQTTVGRTFSFTPTDKKKYVVEAWVNSANASKKDELDDWRFEVTHNKPIDFKGGNSVTWIVGKWYEVELNSIFPFDPSHDGSLTWKSILPGFIEIKETIGNKVKIRAVKQIVAPLPAVSVTMGGKTIMLIVLANFAKVKRWCIADKDFDFKSDAGWGEELYALVESTPAIAGEKIHLHLLERDSDTDSNYIKDLGEVSFDEKGIAKAKFTTDGIKGELLKLWYERGDYELYFAAEVKPGAIQFADMSEKERGGKETIYPATTVHHSEHEKGKLTYIDSKKDITSVRFLKPNGKDAYEIIKYGEKITLKVQTRNLEGTELNLKNILKNNLGSGIKEYPHNIKKKVENETVEWALDTGLWRDWATNKSGVALYQVEIEEADGDKVKYPNEKARLTDGKLDWTKLMTYKTLKLSDDTTLSELAKTNAPLIVGEPLEVEDTAPRVKQIIFPLLVKPENDTENQWGKNYYWGADQGNNMTTFNSWRDKRTRRHAGRDLYTKPRTTVVAIAFGEVIATGSFYAQTDYIAIRHKTNDGREFIINYGEVDPATKKVAVGDKVEQGQELGVTGLLVGITVIEGHTIYMIHFEHYSGDEGFDMEKYHILTKEGTHKRRKDIIDSIEILREGYENTFGKLGETRLFTENDGKEAIKELYNKYKDNSWNWKWNGSEEEVEVTGKDLLTIVEKMYRLETSHFKSKQYQNCGTGGMEVFGTAPYYGWDGSLFTEQPVGIWSAFEGAGLSGSGGNTQVTDRQKEFVKLSSVVAGMEYKIKYIIKYDGNFERWFSKDNETARSTYRSTLKGVRARFIQEIAGN
ncbi:MAG: M23 family metallopeptidase, partial [Moheibacter sp.]